jgi:hypothetical protein
MLIDIIIFIITILNVNGDFAGNIVCKTYMSLWCLIFLICFFTVIFSVYTMRKFLTVFTDIFNDEKIQLIDIIVIYQWRFFVDIFI